MATAELDELFSEIGADTITPRIEVKLTQNGTPKTVLQTDVTVRRDLITSGSAVPASQSSYLTAAESYAAFISNSTTGFNSTSANRRIYSPDGTEKIRATDAGLGFFAASPVAQPSNTNAVSGLISLGLLASGATYGVLPSSPRTLTAVTYTTFGLVPSNNVISKTVTITGCQPNDIVLLGLPADIEEGLAFSGHVVTANQIHIDALNVTGSGKTQTAATYRVTVIGY
jgi:hypothetical protein